MDVCPNAGRPSLKRNMIIRKIIIVEKNAPTASVVFTISSLMRLVICIPPKKKENKL
jgi:hypothetical protein